LELLSDDGEHVLMLDSVDGLGGGGVTFKTRRPWESAWGSHPTFTVNSRDADLVAKLVANQDAKYVERQLANIVTSDFSGKDPNPPEDEAAKLEYEARCTELDIERARAANIQQEFILDHSRDKHITADVTGCPTCEAKVIPSAPFESSPLDRLRDAVDDMEEELPF